MVTNQFCKPKNCYIFSAVLIPEDNQIKIMFHF